jgi:hypothetical protein
MANRNRFFADTDLANQQSNDSLTLGEGQRSRAFPYAQEELFDRGGEGKLGLTIEFEGLQGFQFGQNRALPGL